MLPARAGVAFHSGPGQHGHGGLRAGPSFGQTKKWSYERTTLTYMDVGTWPAWYARRDIKARRRGCGRNLDDGLCPLGL